MAVIGTIESTFLAPGVSANGRLYTAEVIEKAVARMQARLADPDALPITMLSHHAAGDDSKELCARVTTVELDRNTSEARLSGYLIDTRAGRDMAAATEPDSDGRRVLDAVSIRGWWLGPVRTAEHEGQTVQVADDLEIDGVDFTKSPGVAAARITDSKRLAEVGPAARTPITEAVEVHVMSDSRSVVYSTSTPTPAAVPPKPGTPAAEQAATERAPAAPPAVEDAPPEAPPAVEGGNPLAETVALLREAHVALSGWQGPVDIDLSAWGIDNDDVAAAATQLGLAYTAALRVLDPDNDDDLDLPDGDEVAGCGCCPDCSGAMGCACCIACNASAMAAAACPDCGAALPAGAKFCPACGASVAADQETAGDPATDDPTKEITVTETKATEAAGAEGAPAEEGKPENAPAAAATESEPAEGAALTLTAADHEAIASLLHAKLSAAPAAAPAPIESAPPAPAAPAAPALTADTVTEAIRKGAEEAVAAVTDKLRAEMLSSYGPPRRKGLVEAASKGEPEKPLHQMTPQEFTRHAGQVWNGVLGLPTP